MIYNITTKYLAHFPSHPCENISNEYLVAMATCSAKYNALYSLMQNKISQYKS